MAVVEANQAWSSGTPVNDVRNYFAFLNLLRELTANFPRRRENNRYHHS